MINTILFFTMLLPWFSEAPNIPVVKSGYLEVEAEAYTRQYLNEKRHWYTLDESSEFEIREDSHLAGASGGAYLELLPDTRVTHGDKLIQGLNFCPEPGLMAVLDYEVQVEEPGRYYIWVRAYSTGSEDNGIHVGLDGTWPASGQRMQWCAGKNSWTWDSKQRTKEVHCGEPRLIYLDIDTPGKHTISFSMREDGFEFDQWSMGLAYEQHNN